MRFRCLLKERTLRYTQRKAAQFIQVCSALHNMCLRARVPLNDDDNVDDDRIGANPVEDNNRNNVQNGLNARNRIVDDYFTY